MICHSDLKRYRQQIAQFLDHASIVITDAEREDIEVAEFGLGRFEREGLGVLVYENNSRYCAKELVMLPYQTCPQHRHPPITNDAGELIDMGKRETFRCRQGEVVLCVDGAPALSPQAKAPSDSEPYYTVWHEVVLHPGDQYTIEPGVWHWFQAGEQGCIVSEFSSTSRDDADEFADPRVQRVTQPEEQR